MTKGLFIKTSDQDTIEQLKSRNFTLLGIHNGVWIFENNEEKLKNFASLKNVIVDNIAFI